MGLAGLVGERFRVEELVARGGMGAVYRGTDVRSNTSVALKILERGGSDEASRFFREVAALSTLNHERIVGYVAHGTTPRDQPFLAMEWLDGEALSAQIRRGPLAVRDSLNVARQVAEALSAAHARGVVHRDIKPSNLFLVENDPNQLKVLDFGIARHAGDDNDVTETGVIVGTWAYMSPEQVSARRDLDGRSDLFSLGCVLYECLTGKKAFRADQSTALLAKILLEDPPPVHELADVPLAVDQLVSSLLEKTPARRPQDAAAVMLLIDELGEAPASRVPSVLPPALTGDEKRVVSVVFARGVRDLDATISDARDEPAVDRHASLENIARSFDGRLELLANGAVVVTWSSRGAPTDQAMRAARCALAMTPLLSECPMAVATGFGVMSQRAPVGEVIDRGGAALRKSAPGAIEVDALTAGLLGARFIVERDQHAAGRLLGESDAVDGTRKLLGREAPFVGRDRELVTLDAIAEESFQEPVARVALVVGPAGAGKSRLFHEFARRARERFSDFALLFGRAESVSAGAPFAPLAQLVCRAAGARDADSLPERQRKLRARVMAALGSGKPEVEQIVRFLGELAGIRFADDDYPRLAIARRDARVMGDSMRTAFEDWLTAECQLHPVLIVIDDLQWGDLPTVSFLESALRNLADQPLMVLALARPGVHEQFPDLWREQHLQELGLGPLTKRAARSLLTRVLGEGVPEEVMWEVIERGEGNAFYLEELIRAVAEGRAQTLPHTVLGMVQARLDNLDPEFRRVLRAASLFGHGFSASGVTQLLGRNQPASGVAPVLDELSTRELLTRSDPPELAGEPVYSFRHALVRDGTYATLTDEDQQLGHRLVAEFLEQSGVAEPLVIAQHFLEGSAAERAAAWYLKAAEKAMEGYDYQAVTQHTEVALKHSADPALTGALTLLQAEALRWAGHYQRARESAARALSLFEPRSARWFAALAEAAYSAGEQADFAAVEELAQLGPGRISEDARAPRATAICRCAAKLLEGGRYQRADELLVLAERDLKSVQQGDPRARAWWLWTIALRAYSAGDPSYYVRASEVSLRALREIGDQRVACTQEMNLGYGLAQVGDFDRAEQLLRSALAAAQRMGLSSTEAFALHNLGYVLAATGKLEEGEAVERRAVTLASRLGDRLHGATQMYLSWILALSGKPELALAPALRAVELFRDTRPVLPLAMASEARARLELGEPGTEALAQRALESFEQHCENEEGEHLIRLVLSEALHRAGDIGARDAAIRAAHERLLTRASAIKDAAHRHNFLHRVPENRRTLELSGAWLGLRGDLA